MKTLPNGAIELDRKVVSASKEIVIATWMRGKAQEFVTWAVYHRDDKSTSHGNYFTDIADAVADFKRRN